MKEKIIKNNSKIEWFASSALNKLIFSKFRMKKKQWIYDKIWAEGKTRKTNRKIRRNKRIVWIKIMSSKRKNYWRRDGNVLKEK